MAQKIDHIQNAYSQLRISGLTIQPTPENVYVALSRLEDMMDEYFGVGLCAGYNFEDVPDVTTPSGVQRRFNQMIATNLAVRLIPDFNKQVPQTLINLASAAYSRAYGMVALDNIRQVQAPDRMPVGSGHRYRSRYQRYYRNEHLPPNECETIKLIVGNINDYVSEFGSYLNDEDIQSYTIEVSAGLRLVSDSSAGSTVSYRIEAISESTGSGQIVSIVVLSNTGRKHTHNINFLIAAGSAGFAEVCDVSNIADIAIADCAIAG